MNNPLIVALAITLAGMVLLFLALTFFYGLLSAIASLLHERLGGGGPAGMEEEAQDGEAGQADEAELIWQAAAIAVALARAEAGAWPPAGEEEAEAASPWWTLHQQRRMAASTSLWRTP